MNEVEKERVGQVQEQSDYLETVTHHIGDQIEQLEERLTKVLGPSPPSDVNKKGTPEQELAPLAGFLRDRTQFLTSQVDWLRDIISRIEL